MNNVGGGVETVRRKEAILLEHCEAVGRDPARDRADDRDRDRLHPRRPGRGGARLPRGVRAQPDRPALGGPAGRARPEDVAERLAPYLEIGYRHLVAGFPATYDEESMTRLVTEVKPMLEAMG